jgi:predicted aconitase with swiveling domain
MLLEGRRLTMKKGACAPIEAELLKSDGPISFLGDVDPASGTINDRKNNLYGQTIKDKVFAFPMGKGSTVGSYIMYRLSKNGCAPKAIINTRAETIVAVGAVISDIPLIDRIDLGKLNTGQHVRIIGGKVEIV